METELATVLPTQLALIKKTVAAGATADELELYLYDCQRQGVHPLDKLIHFTKRGGKYVPITSIDFLRMQAGKTGEYAGADDAVFTGEPGKPGFAATMTVYRMVASFRCAWTATARWEEYFPGEQQGHMWRKMPHVMLCKVVESLVLRKSFADVLHGLYTHEEMAQAQKSAPDNRSLKEKLGMAVETDETDSTVEPEAIVEEVAAPSVEAVNGTEIWTIGKHKGVPLSAMPHNYLEWACANITSEVLRGYATAELQRRGLEVAAGRL
jgi:hypothetical protein